MSEQKPNKGPGGAGPGGGAPFKGNRNIIIMMVIMLMLYVGFSGMDKGWGDGEIHELSYKELIDALEKNHVKDAILRGRRVVGHVDIGGEKATEFETVVSGIDQEIIKVLQKHAGEFSVEEEDTTWRAILVSLLPWLLIFAFFYFFLFRQMRGGGGPGGIMSFGRSKATMVEKDKLTKTFADVAGIDEAKEEVQEIVSFLKEPERFTKIGGRMPRGILLVGSPGTGKTLLAKAIAGEAGRPFFSISGSDFVEMFVGVGASRVRDLFSQAKENSPCIIFLDEIDAVGRRRGQGVGGGNDEREQTLNAILVEMDGFEDNEGVIIIAATNRPDVLDPALLRPGRFDRQVHVDLPDIKGREQILQVHAKKVKLSQDVDLGVVARGTPGFSGAELENLINEAAMISAFKNRKNISPLEMEEARDKVCWGKAKRSRVMSDEDNRCTAYHEAGHAVLGMVVPELDPLHKVTIVPRGRALGMAMYLPDRDRYDRSRRSREGNLIMTYGGRVAEEIFCDDIGAGAIGDMQSATKMARSMVTEWGMSEKLGPVYYEEADGESGWGGDVGPKRAFSEKTLQEIDDEIRRILNDALNDARRLIEENRDAVIRVAEALIIYETLDREEVDMLMKGEDITARMEAISSKRDKEQKNDAGPSAGAPDTTLLEDKKDDKGNADNGGTEPPTPAPIN